jgi:pyruvate dehydrogenase E2 component (dihydrolipoamide acetyltransferase)
VTPPPIAIAAAASDDSVVAPRVLATPVTRRIAREHGIDLAAVEGTGPGGRVLKSDVLRVAALGESGQGELAPRQSASEVSLAALPGDRRLPLKGVRRAIAKRMAQSKRTAAHYTFVEELDATELKALRERVNRRLAEMGDPLRLSFLPFVCKAVVAALHRHPTLNAVFDEQAQELVIRQPVNLGIAVATEDGLVVPVVQDASAKSLRTLAEEIGTLSSAAKQRRLTPQQLAGGTFSLTSLGKQGGLFATPIINWPQVAILGIHRMRPRPVVRNGEVVVRQMMYLSLSLDHRLIDGAVGAAFAYDLIALLEAPELLMVDLASSPRPVE